MNICAALIDKPGEDFHFETLEFTSPQRDEVLVKLAACGVVPARLALARELGATHTLHA